MSINLFKYCFAVALSVGLLSKSIAQQTIDPSHLVPVNKNLGTDWNHSLYNSDRKPFTGKELSTIGMPCGGIGAGQLYVRGDGTLACWWIANDAYNTGYGHSSTNNFLTALGAWKDCYQTYRPFSYIQQGFTINGRSLNQDGFDAIEFTGEYPVATIEYKDKLKPLPYAVRLQVFSPYIPMDAKKSATPGTVLQYTIVNTSNTTQKISLTGFQQNMVGIDGKDKYRGTLFNQVFKGNGLTGVSMSLNKATLPNQHPWNGNICLSMIGDGTASADQNKQVTTAESPLDNVLNGSVTKNLILVPGQSQTVTFLLTWYFPNRNHYIDVPWTKSLTNSDDIIGNNYANWFSSSKNVAEWLTSNLPRLQKETFLFHDAYYNHSTLPYWLNRRLMMPMSTLATETCQWWADGKFFAWEGVGSCVGTCTHVWNYEQGMAHLFPELERNVRERTDFANSYLPDGRILTRDGHTEFGWEMDGTAGTVLKAYREDLLSSDHRFLNAEWPKIKQTMRFLISQDGNADGLIEGRQPNTYDIAFYGANTYVGSLYLAALRAAAEMALLENDRVFADSCRLIADRGKENSAKRLFNGEYFVQDVDLKAHPMSQYGTGCLSDQLFGDTWAGLYHLGNLYDPDETISALHSIYQYNWAPDVGPQNKVHPAERDYADPREAGLFVCTWPHSAHPGENGVRYRDEVWTGIEYQVATDLIAWNGVDEALTILKGLDERYQPHKHNPWNEIECGDHYARAMASWGVLLALQDYDYDGPAGKLAFSPKITQDHFESFFTGAESWGNIAQERSANKQTNTIAVKYGKLKLKQVRLQLSSNHFKEIQMQVNGKPVHIQAYPIPGAKFVNVSFAPQTFHAGQTIKILIIT